MSIPKKFKDNFTSVISLSQYDYNIGDDISVFLQKGNGMSKFETVKFIDTGGLYFYTVKTDIVNKDSVRISIVSKDETQCVVILVNKKTHVSALLSMSDTGKCVSEGLNKSISKGGTKILKVALNIILNNKKKYNIERIVLKDNSYLACDNSPNPVKLAQIRMVLKGEPWFSSYGFRPIDNNSKPDKLKLKAIETNNEIFDRLKTKDVNISKIIGSVIKKQIENKIDIAEISKLVNEHPLMRNFIIRLTMEFDKYCCLLSYLLDFLFNPISKTGLTDFYNGLFYLDI